jgi:hypothetical protein
LNANITRASALRYGDAKTLPAVDVHLQPGFDSVPLRMLPGIQVSYNTGELQQRATVSAVPASGVECFQSAANMLTSISQETGELSGVLLIHGMHVGVAAAWLFSCVLCCVLGRLWVPAAGLLSTLVKR